MKMRRSAVPCAVPLRSDNPHPREGEGAPAPLHSQGGVGGAERTRSAHGPAQACGEKATHADSRTAQVGRVGGDTAGLDGAASRSVRLRTFTLPLRTVAGLNAREHWRARSRRVKAERMAARTFTCSTLRGESAPLPCIVTMTRFSAGELDGDNLQGALKAVRDGIADALGVDDRDKRVEWRYEQRRVARGIYGVLIEVRSTGSTEKSHG